MITNLAVYSLNLLATLLPVHPVCHLPCCQCRVGLDSSLWWLSILCGRIFDISSVCHAVSSPASLLVRLLTISIRKPSQVLKFSNCFPQATQASKKTCKFPLCIRVQSLEDSLSLSRNVQDLLVAFLCFSSGQKPFSTWILRHQSPQRKQSATVNAASFLAPLLLF